MPHPAQLSDPEKIRVFALAGRARLTLVSERTGQRFTYQVKAKKDKEGNFTDFYFVSVLTGPQNTSDYTYLGCVRDGSFVHDRLYRVGPEAPSRKAFAWFWARLNKGRELSECECWHEGRCGRCGRLLTVPESIESGLGPKCAGAMR